MVFHWSLSDSKSPQVFRTLLSIMADLHNAVVWKSSIHPLMSKSSNPCTSPLVTVSSAPITTGITVTFMFHSFSISLARSKYLSVFSLSFSFTKRKCPQFGCFSFFVDYLVVWPRLVDPFVSQKPKEIFVSHFLGGIWIVHITFVRMVKFKLFAQLPIDYLPYPVVSSLILFLRKFTAFDYYMIDSFVSITI